MSVLSRSRGHGRASVRGSPPPLKLTLRALSSSPYPPHLLPPLIMRLCTPLLAEHCIGSPKMDKIHKITIEYAKDTIF